MGQQHTALQCLKQLGERFLHAQPGGDLIIGETVDHRGGAHRKPLTTPNHRITCPTQLNDMTGHRYPSD